MDALLIPGFIIVGAALLVHLVLILWSRRIVERIHRERRPDGGPSHG